MIQRRISTRSEKFEPIALSLLYKAKNEHWRAGKDVVVAGGGGGGGRWVGCGWWLLLY